MSDLQQAGAIMRRGSDGPVAVVREEFGAVEQRQQLETASTAVAARQQAMVQSRFIMAMKNPRDTDEFRVRLLKECRRPGFAEMVEYSRPVGFEYNEDTGQWEKKIAHGPSVHLIRTALALYKNIDADSVVMFESKESRVTHTYILDLETNVGWGRTLVVPKIVEKRGKKGRHGETEPPKGRDVLGTRVNTDGEMVYIVSATDDEIRNKEANLVAKAQRENGRSLLPRDILDEAIRVAKETLAKADKEDPDAGRRRLIDGFAGLNVTPGDLADYLGHQVDKITPAELAELRKVFVALREGDISWTEVMTEKNPSGSAEAAQKVGEEKLTRLRNLGQKKSTSDDSKVDPGSGRQSGAPAQSAAAAGAESAAADSKPEAAPNYVPEREYIQLLKRAGDLGWSTDNFRAWLRENGIENESKIPRDRFKEIVQAVEAGTGGEPVEDEPADPEPQPEPAATGKTQRRLKL